MEKKKKKKKKKIYLPNESHIKLNQVNAKGGLPEEQTLKYFWVTTLAFWCRVTSSVT